MWQSNGSPKDEEGNPILKETSQMNKETDWSSDVPSTSGVSNIQSFQCASTPSNSVVQLGTSTRTVKDVITELQLLAPEGMKYELRLVPKDEVISIESILKSRGRKTNDEKKKRKRIK